MSSIWVADRESEIFTIVRKKVLDAYKTTYKDLYFTREEDNDELETNLYPACYFHFAEVEKGRDLQGTGVNAVLMRITVDVKSSESMGISTSKTIAYAIFDELKALGFYSDGLPEQIKTDTDVKRMIIKVERILGFNDVLSS